jgi:SulP family sulfate permease
VPAGDGDLVRRTPRSLRTLLPALEWAPRYQIRRDLPADLVAGVALAALLIPEAIGYAGIAGVPPEVGLYAAIAAVAAYALTGGTSILVVGPASAVAALSASIVGRLGDGSDAVALTSALAITSGVVLTVAGLLRLGWVVNFISRPVLDAFVAGLSTAIIVGQLDDLLGLPLRGSIPLTQAFGVLTRVDEWHLLTVALGLVTLTTLITMERYVRRIPAALVVLVAALVLAHWVALEDRGIEVLGHIPEGLPAPGIPQLGVEEWLQLLAGGVAVLLVGFSEGFAAATSIADRTGEDVEADQELVGAGSANLASGLVGGLAVSGSLSKTAAARAAGARTQGTNLVAGAIVLASLLFLAPVFERLPATVVAAVVIAAVLPAADPRRVLRLRRVNRLDFAAGLATYVLVLVWETLPAMVVGVVLSLAFLVRRASFPHVVELRRGEDGLYVEVETGGPAVEDPPPGVAVIRFEAPLVYANADRLGRAVQTLLEERPGLRRIVLDTEMVADLDSDGADALAALDEHLADRGVELRLARVHRRVRAQMDRSGLGRRFEGRIHPFVLDAGR